MKRQIPLITVVSYEATEHKKHYRTLGCEALLFKGSSE